ncbi:mycothiol-dependent nitroreductase Rv2466c family protein [Streptomyces sp. TP-A0874]|uniref:mycothiol-dependent nitroreductase Rv2466c family protein n=1 Tax=Streptomyces sp. TP-A0874 TaxID=549819 RepID=UPI00085344F4|nr:hypothetical protein [Streptomyces sp. TP-A0874]
MSQDRTPVADVYVDPQCPFAWITTQWLLEAARHTPLAVGVHLMSLSCVNEGRELDPWYRKYNDEAWSAARVAAALLDSDRSELWPRFYETFGRRRHVDGVRDNPLNLRETVSELDLPAALLDAAADPSRDDDLRRRTAEAIAGCGGDGGTPMVHVHGRAFFGPVLTEIPRGAAAVELWQAVETMARTRGFSSLTTERGEQLHTS